MAFKEAIADDIVALIITISVVPVLCYVAVLSGDATLIYALMSAVVGYYFGKKVGQ